MALSFIISSAKVCTTIDFSLPSISESKNEKRRIKRIFWQTKRCNNSRKMLLLFRHPEDRPFPDNGDRIHRRRNPHTRRWVNISLPSIRLHPMHFDIEYPTETFIPSVASRSPITERRRRRRNGTSPRLWAQQPPWKSPSKVVPSFSMGHHRETAEWSSVIRVTRGYVEETFLSIDVSARL